MDEYQLKPQTNIDYRFVSNKQLRKDLIKRIKEEVSRRSNSIFVARYTLAIVVDEEHIGYAICRNIVIPDKPDFPENQIILFPIFFPNCKTIEDVLRAYSMDDQFEYLISNPYYVHESYTTDNNGYNCGFPTSYLTCFLEKISIHVSPDDIIFNIKPREGSSNGVYWALQNGFNPETRIYIDVASLRNPKIYKPWGLLKYVKNFYNYAKSALTSSINQNHIKND